MNNPLAFRVRKVTGRHRETKGRNGLPPSDVLVGGGEGSRNRVVQILLAELLVGEELEVPPELELIRRGARTLTNGTKSSEMEASALRNASLASGIIAVSLRWAFLERISSRIWCRDLSTSKKARMVPDPSGRGAARQANKLCHPH